MQKTPRRQLLLRLPPIALVATAAASWNFFATGHFSILALFFFVVLISLCVAAGDLLVAYGLGGASRFDSFSIRLLSGFLAINAALYILVLILPIGIMYCATLIAVAVFCACGGVKKFTTRTILPVCSSLEIGFLLFSVIAISFWCQDLFNPLIAGPTETTIRAWPDVFFHLRQISIFASANGASSISDFQMAGAPSHGYHYASYMLPSALMAMAPTTSLQAYCGTYVPFGLLLTALASFSLMSSLFGKWPGAAAGLALLLAPDALQQGFGNGFLSYHWLQQVGPAGLYGIAVAALAWLVMFKACRECKMPLILAAYFIAGCVAIFKAQIFVANAYLIFIFPSLFMVRLTTRARRIYFYVATGLFLLTVYISQYSKNVPVIRLDGTGIGSYGASLLSAQNQGVFYSYVAYIFESAMGFIFVSGTSIILLLGTFGAWIIIYALIVFGLKQKLETAIVVMPILVVVNYLLMSQGLAMDSNGVGRPEELLNRPFVWAYFVMCSWSAAGLYFLFFGDDKPKGNFSKVVAASILIAGIAIPFHFGHNIHSLAQWLPNVDGVQIPTCVVKSAEYIRDVSSPSAIIQDSSNDTNFALTALAERQEFAIHSGGVRAPEGVHRRLAQLNYKLKKFETESAVLEFFNQNSIAWYLRRPDDILMWPESMERYVEYRCDGYRTYHFNSLVNLAERK